MIDIGVHLPDDILYLTDKSYRREFDHAEVMRRRVIEDGEQDKAELRKRQEEIAEAKKQDILDFPVLLPPNFNLMPRAEFHPDLSKFWPPEQPEYHPPNPDEPDWW